MSKRISWGYLALFVVLAIITCFLEPHDDDWQYLYYFDNPHLWGLSKETFKWDCILLPGTYWRPLWSMFNWAEAHWLPMSMPYANHIFIVFGMVGISYMTRMLMVKLGINERLSTFLSVTLILSTTSMGALLSVDSFQNVYAAFWGIMSVLIFISESRYRWLWWFMTGWLAAMGKETGFVWFLAGPVIEELLRQKKSLGSFSFADVNYNSFLPKLLICSIPILIYLGSYVLLKPTMLNSVGYADDKATVQTEIVENVGDNGMLTTMTEMKKHNSYKLTPSTLVKNIGVLYVFGLFPIDTSSIYFKTYILLGITFILALVWIAYFFGGVIRRYPKANWQEMIVWLLLMLWISGPSLVTRAGEISPIIHMTILTVIVAMMFNGLTISRLGRLAIFCFFIATTITDIHKYYISYKAGAITRSMARQIVAETEGKPDKVLFLQVNDFENKKSGAFMINPADGVRKGSAMIREYEYKYPKLLVYQSIPMELAEAIPETVDSLVEAAKGEYDCIWFCHDVSCKVYNIKHYRK